jgi:hypothetical protein
LCNRTPLYGLRSNTFPAPRSPSTVTPLPENFDRTFPRHYDYKCSSTFTICRTQALKQVQSWSSSDSCGQAYRRTAELGHGLVKPANARKSTTTQSPFCEISH